MKPRHAPALALVVYYNVHVHNLEVSYAAQKVAAVTAAVKTASDELKAAAHDKSLKDAATYADNLKRVNETYAKQSQADAATHFADLQRLRQLASAGNSAPTVVSAASRGQRSRLHVRARDKNARRRYGAAYARCIPRGSRCHTRPVRVRE